MNTAFFLAPLVLLAPVLVGATKPTVTTNLPYAQPAHAFQKLDIYAPPNARNLPVVFWIHGGGWQAGDKSSFWSACAGWA